jgi:hypothetical protein
MSEKDGELNLIYFVKRETQFSRNIRLLNEEFSWTSLKKKKRPIKKIMKQDYSLSSLHYDFSNYEEKTYSTDLNCSCYLIFN